MKQVLRVIYAASAMAIFLLAGIALGSWPASRLEAQNKFGQPKTVIHVVIYKWKESVSDSQKEIALTGIKAMAGKIPGVKNVWLKTSRLQLRDFSGAFAIEFASAEAAADYAESPVHQSWSKNWQELRETSLSLQITNP
ncbi:MAG TPA: Dabb family protein [Candidatus Dormibacteraeota bacterium]|nr:Dabb family protein [Candidatus Dormibacteraeota bacterium]